MSRGLLLYPLGYFHILQNDMRTDMQGDKPALLLGSSDGQELGDTMGWKNAHEQDAEIDLFCIRWVLRARSMGVTDADVSVAGLGMSWRRPSTGLLPQRTTGSGWSSSCR